MICFDCLDGYHGPCVRQANLPGQNKCECSTCVRSLDVIRSARSKPGVTTRLPVSPRVRKSYPRKPGPKRIRRVEVDQRRLSIPLPMQHAIAEALIRGEASMPAIAEQTGCGYNQVRTIKRQLRQLNDPEYRERTLEQKRHWREPARRVDSIRVAASA